MDIKYIECSCEECMQRKKDYAVAYVTGAKDRTEVKGRLVDTTSIRLLEGLTALVDEDEDGSKSVPPVCKIIYSSLSLLEQIQLVPEYQALPEGEKASSVEELLHNLPPGVRLVDLSKLAEGDVDLADILKDFGSDDEEVIH